MERSRNLPNNFPEASTISTMTSVSRLIKHYESMSNPGGPLAVLPERSLRDSLSESPCGTIGVNPPPQLDVNDRQSCEPCVSGSRLPEVGPVGSCRAFGGPSDTRRETYVSKRNTLFLERDSFWDFPYVGAGRFRENLYGLRQTYDPDYVLTEVSARLGPSEVDPLAELNELVVNELTPDASDVRSNNPYTVLEDIEDGCFRSRSLGGKARQLVSWFQGFGLTKVRDLPVSITCGGLRSSVRQCFPDVDPVWDLSFKTVAKIERSCCKFCLPLYEQKLTDWKEARIQPKPVDSEHLLRFRNAFRRNVDKGWDSRRRPFIPNGNATSSFTRKDGGNWNLEPFSDEFRTELVFSSGKPRVVTLYSSENTRVLGPLHYSLYDNLRRKGWLLVGEPTEKHIQKLNGAELLSFDYSSATDNIKTDYVLSAIDILIEQADSLSDSELSCLHVLGNLSLEGVCCGSGQPMGSVMSFPLLCLINKTVVDLSMDRLLVGKEISFSEWSSHRLLINGDDLLTREVRKKTNLRGYISEEGLQVGLVVNTEKTMSSFDHCEINSTLFTNGRKVRKFNASAVWMDPGVEDVLGFAAQASPSVKVFRKLVRWNANILAKASDKHLAQIPPHLQVVCRKDKKIRRAITSLPKSDRPIVKSVIRMAPEPDGYDLVTSEEHQAMLEEIERCREEGVAWASAKAARKKFRTTAIPNQISYSKALKQRQTSEQELIPACYVRAYTAKLQDALVEEYVAGSSSETLPPGDGSRISVIMDNMRLFKQKKAVSSPGTIEVSADFVRLD